MKMLKHNQNSLKILHLNVRSYSNNRNAIEYLICKDRYDIYVFTETWLQKSISIPTNKFKIIDLFSKNRG